jgi:probable rRNA maturation factor
VTAPADGGAALDLAFGVDQELAAELRRQAGTLADPLEGEARWAGLIGSWLADLAAELPTELRAEAYSLGLNLCGDAEIAALNAQWRHREGPTDVLAFAARDAGLEAAPPMPLPEGPEAGIGGGEPLELGDIVISLETAARQAAAAGSSLERELGWLASHGLLHLLGWDHPDEASLEAMLARQDRLLAVPDGAP